MVGLTRISLSFPSSASPQARRLVKTDPAEMVKICHQLLDRPDVETAIRVGDGFALLIEFYYAQRNMEQVRR